MARYGINVRDVEDVIEMAIGGKPISTVFEGEQRFDVTVRFREQSRADADAIGNILVPTHEGGRVPLSQLARIEVVNGASIIARRENIRQISVRTNIRGRDQGSFVKEAQSKFEHAVKLPPGYSVDWGGQFENLERARKRLTIILPITIGIIFALLFFAFGDAVHAGLVLVNVPFSLVGGIVFLYLRGINLSVSAAVGFHLTLRRSGDERRLVHFRNQPTARRTGDDAGGRRDSGRQGAIAAKPDADSGGHAGNGAGRAGHRNRQRHSTAAGDGGGGRPAFHAIVDTAGAA